VSGGPLIIPSEPRSEKSKISKILSRQFQEISIQMVDLGPGMSKIYPDMDLGYPKPLFTLKHQFFAWWLLWSIIMHCTSIS